MLKSLQVLTVVLLGLWLTGWTHISLLALFSPLVLFVVLFYIVIIIELKLDGDTLKPWWKIIVAAIKKACM